MKPNNEDIFQPGLKNILEYTSLRDQGKGSARNICKKSLGRDVYLGFPPFFDWVVFLMFISMSCFIYFGG